MKRHRQLDGLVRIVQQPYCSVIRPVLRLLKDKNLIVESESLEEVFACLMKCYLGFSDEYEMNLTRG